MRTVPMNLLFDDIEVIESVGRPLHRPGRRHHPRQPEGGAGGPVLLRPRPGQRRARPRRRGGGAGAVGLLCEHFIPELIGRDVVQTRIAPGTMRTVMARLAAAFYSYPARDLLMIGVTGTNGKTTVTQLLGDLLGATGRPDQCDGHALGREDDARGDGGPACARRRAGPAEVRRRPARGRHGGVEPRAGAVAGGGHPLRRGRLHQPEPRSPRLPPDHGGLLRGEGDALHLAPRAARGGERRRSVGSAASGEMRASRPSPCTMPTPPTWCCGRDTPSSPGAASGSRRR